MHIQITKQFDLERAEELETENYELKKERDTSMNTINELYEKVGLFDVRTQQLKATVVFFFGIEN